MASGQLTHCLLSCSPGGQVSLAVGLAPEVIVSAFFAVGTAWLVWEWHMVVGPSCLLVGAWCGIVGELVAPRGISFLQVTGWLQYICYC